MRSIVGRFLEHHRIYYFRNGGEPRVYLSSADWMGRNLFRRIEIAWPVLEPKLARRVIDEGLKPYLDDTRDAWTLTADGDYRPPRGGASARSAQQQLLIKLAASVARSLTMELILWRHAEAEIGEPDLGRKLTARGEKQARRVAEWLHAQLPDSARILVSPATRAQQTARALAEVSHRKLRTVDEIAPGAGVRDVLDAADWPHAKVPDRDRRPSADAGPGRELPCWRAKCRTGRSRKAGVWWFSSRERDGEEQTVLRAVISPGLAVSARRYSGRQT